MATLPPPAAGRKPAGPAPAAHSPAQPARVRHRRPADDPAPPAVCLVDHQRALVGAIAGALMDMADATLEGQDWTTCPCTCGRCFSERRDLLSQSMVALAMFGEEYEKVIRSRTSAPAPRDTFEDIPDVLREIARQWRQVLALRRERERWYAKRRKEREKAETKLPPKG